MLSIYGIVIQQVCMHNDLVSQLTVPIMQMTNILRHPHLLNLMLGHLNRTRDILSSRQARLPLFIYLLIFNVLSGLKMNKIPLTRRHRKSDMSLHPLILVVQHRLPL